MKARLTKKLEVKSVITYLVIETEQERKDIQEFLNDKKFKDDVINQRVYEYLRSIRVLDENNLPTQKGDKIKKTGKMPVKQEGKYRVWFIEDNFLGKKILHFKRIEPKKDMNNLSELKISFDKENHYYLPLDETNNEKQPEEFFIFNVLNGNENKPYEEYNNSIDITLTWMWEEFEKSYLIFTGNLVPYQVKQKNGNHFNQKLKPAVEIPYKYDLEKCIQEILTDWDYKFKKYKIRFEELKDDNEKKHFEKNITIQNGWKNFDIQFEKVPLMPYDKENAEKWRNWLVIQELEKEYLNPNDFLELATEINQKTALASFDFSEVHPYEFIKNIKKTENTNAYWHLRATLDLNPNKDVLKSYSKIELEKNRRISFEVLAQQLKSGITEINKPFNVFYYDKHIKNNIQQKTVMTFIRAIQATRSYVITDIENSYSNLLKNEPNLHVIDLKEIFGKPKPAHDSKPAHDRYLVLKQGEKLIAWVCTNSIDYIRFNEQNFDEKTLGTIQQSVVFTRIENNNTLAENLRTFIKSK